MSENAPFAWWATRAGILRAVQFHPEVAHTPHGALLIATSCATSPVQRQDWTMNAFREEAIVAHPRTGRHGYGDISGLSGGVDFRGRRGVSTRRSASS
jgi:GMP synthase (glutamine-hydrolysing)